MGIIVCTAIGYASAYLSPRYFWWTGPLASVLPWLSAFAAPILVLGMIWGAYRQVWPVALGAGGALMLLALRFGPLLNPFPISTAADGERLRVMSFNAPTQDAHQHEAAQELVALARAERPHVIELQEVKMTYADSTERRMGTSTQMIGLLSQLDYVPELPDYPAHLHQPVVAVGPLTALRRYDFSFPWGVFAPTWVTTVRFPWADQVVTLLNVHLHTVSSRKPWRDPRFSLWDLRSWWGYVKAYRAGALRRAAEARRIRELIEGASGPLLVTGDFNSTPHSWVYRHLASGLQDAHTVSGRGLGFTYPAACPLVRIDYILASSHFEVVSAHVPEQYARSDHRPVVAHLRLRDERMD